MARLVTSHYVCVDGRLVHYRRSGDGPPVVLLHASPRSSIALVPLMQACPADITVFAFDTPGCGYSAPLPLGRPDVPDYAHAFAATLDALGIQRAPTYGTHTGAAIALTFAALYPERVSQLVLDGLSAFCADERAAILAGYLPPFTPHVDGTHLSMALGSRARSIHFLSVESPWCRRAPSNGISFGTAVARSGTRSRSPRVTTTAPLIQQRSRSSLNAGSRTCGCPPVLARDTMTCYSGISNVLAHYRQVLN